MKLVELVVRVVLSEWKEAEGCYNFTNRLDVRRRNVTSSN